MLQQHKKGGGPCSCYTLIILLQSVVRPNYHLYDDSNNVSEIVIHVIDGILHRCIENNGMDCSQEEA